MRNPVKLSGLAAMTALAAYLPCPRSPEDELSLISGETTDFKPIEPLKDSQVPKPNSIKQPLKITHGEYFKYRDHSELVTQRDESIDVETIAGVSSLGVAIAAALFLGSFRFSARMRIAFPGLTSRIGPATNLSDNFLKAGHAKGRDLRGFRLSNDVLGNYNIAQPFNKARLDRFLFEDAVRLNISLYGANLSGLDFEGYNFSFPGSNQLACITLDGSKLRGCILKNLDLRHSSLKNVDLTQADLTLVNLFAADLSGSDLSRANLRGVILRNANLSDTILDGANLAGADLRNATLPDDVSNINFDDAQISQEQADFIVDRGGDCFCAVIS